MAHATFEDGSLKYKKMFSSRELPARDIVWAYLQQEDVSAKVCCGRTSFEIGRLIVLDREGRREVFQYEGLDEPSRLLDALHAANASIAIGYTPENRARFEKA